MEFPWIISYLSVYLTEQNTIVNVEIHRWIKIETPLHIDNMDLAYNNLYRRRHLKAK